MFDPQSKSPRIARNHPAQRQFGVRTTDRKVTTTGGEPTVPIAPPIPATDRSVSARSRSRRPAEANDAVIGVMITTYSVSCKGALRSESRLHDTWRSLVGSAGDANATLSKPGAET